MDLWDNIYYIDIDIDMWYLDKYISKLSDCESKLWDNKKLRYQVSILWNVLNDFFSKVAERRFNKLSIKQQLHVCGPTGCCRCAQMCADVRGWNHWHSCWSFLNVSGRWLCKRLNVRLKVETRGADCLLLVELEAAHTPHHVAERWRLKAAGAPTDPPSPRRSSMRQNANILRHV